MFSTYGISIVRLRQYYLGIMPLDYQLDLNKYNFLVQNLYDTSSNQSVINHIFLNKSDELDDLVSKYGLVIGENINIVHSKVLNHFESSIHDNIA
jgi:hypothetical protein